ncbi:MAG: hypothetical protein ACPGLV_10410 [Bacteroidia bacterium]
MYKSEIVELEEIYSAPIKYYYYKDRYLVQSLLENQNGDTISVATIKNDFDAKLFQKNWFKEQFLQNSGNRKVCKDSLEFYWPKETFEFDIEVSKWGEEPKKHKKDKWLQTTRSGYSLVLRINLSQEHFELYRSWLKPSWYGEGIFNCTCHPVSEKDITLGWVRLDLDFETDEVLIEELQTDWLRELNKLAKNLRNADVAKCKQLLMFENIEGSLIDFWKYYNYMLPISKMWDELFISATLWFVKNELQIKKVWMHSYETCSLFKDQQNAMPPRSLYTKLPKKMGFVKTEKAPSFLQNEVYLKRYFRKSKRENIKWFCYE